MRLLSRWMDIILRLAAGANIPKSGTRIKIPGQSSPYFLVVEVTEGRDPRGQKTWIARAKGQDGSVRTFNSDDVPRWEYYSGEEYDWDKEEQLVQTQQRAQKEQAELVSNFEKRFRFPDGRPLRAIQGRRMMVTVKPDAPGNLGAFRDERLYVDEIDYSNDTVKMSPVGHGLQGLAKYLESIPASEVVSGTTPSLPQVLLQQPAKVIDPRSPSRKDYMKVDMARVISMTPLLNQLAEDGQVSLRARVFRYYQSKGMGGEEHFEKELALFGASPEEIPHSIMATETESKRRGAYTGTVVISPPFDSKQLMDELRSVGPDYEIRTRSNGSVEIDNVYLFRSMLALGVRGEEYAEASWLRQPGAGA